MKYIVLVCLNLNFEKISDNKKKITEIETLHKKKKWIKRDSQI